MSDDARNVLMLCAGALSGVEWARPECWCDGSVSMSCPSCGALEESDAGLRKHTEDCTLEAALTAARAALAEPVQPSDDAELDSPNFTPAASKELEARDYVRVNRHAEPVRAGGFIGPQPPPEDFFIGPTQPPRDFFIGPGTVRTYEDGVRERHLRDVLTRSVTAIDVAVDAMLNGGLLSQPAYELSAVRGDVAGLLETPPVAACAECGEHPVGECAAAKQEGVREERARWVTWMNNAAKSADDVAAIAAARGETAFCEKQRLLAATVREVALLASGALDDSERGEHVE